MVKKAPFRFFSALLISLFSLPAMAVDDMGRARDVLAKMAEANRALDYQGVFTYEHAGVLKSIRILHVVRDNLEYEHMLYLNGPRKEVVRKGIPLSCKKQSDKFWGVISTAADSQLEQYYELFLRGEDRIANRQVRILQVVPKDDLRYGYVLFIDKETNLLLQSLLIGTNRKAMERFQYVDIDMSPEAELVDALLSDEDSGNPGDYTSEYDCSKAEPADNAPWQAGWMPAGFELVSGDIGENGKTSLSYSDGLSFVSIFVDEEEGNSFPEIQAQRGATVAQVSKQTHLGRQYTICVVGEVPPEVAGRIGQFVVPAGAR